MLFHLRVSLRARAACEVTGPGFAYSHHQLPATISTYTGNPGFIPVYLAPRDPPIHMNETVSVLKLTCRLLLSFRLFSQSLPLYSRCFSLTMIAVYCVHDLFLSSSHGYILYTSSRTWTTNILTVPSSLHDARRFSVGSSVERHASL